jgi:hypothetical protein
VSQSPLPKAQSLQGAKPAHMRRAGASQKRRRLVKMSLGVISIGALIAAVAVFAIVSGTAPSPVAENAAARSEPNSVATIVLRSDAGGCHQKVFNNQTGQISDQSSRCQNEVALDANGMPIPAGTIHTLNSISKSFK